MQLHNRRSSPEMVGVRLIRSPFLRFLLYVVLGIGLISIFYWMYNPRSNWKPYDNPVGPLGYPSFEVEPDPNLIPQSTDGIMLSHKEFSEKCLNGQKFSRSITGVFAVYEALNMATSETCKELYKIFSNIIVFDRINEAKIVFPDNFIPQVKSWLGNNEELFQEMYNQKIYKVVSVLTGEETIYNPLRSRRPVSKSGKDPVQYVEDLVKESQPTCDFCRYKDHTAADSFGRVENKYSATASNTFKLAQYHGLFFPLAHHPVNISYSVLEDLFLRTSVQWFERAHEQSPYQIFPSIVWDSLPHAGASQVHPHIHGMLDSKQYAGPFEALHKGAGRYYKKYARSYWKDFIAVHKALGLTFQQGKAVAVVAITARKDHEFWIIAPEMSQDVTKLLYRILQAYRHKLNTFCHSAGGVYPVLGDNSDPYLGLPLIIRLGSRRDCTSLLSDVGALELYTVNNINTNLADTIAALEDTLSYVKDEDLVPDTRR